MKLVCAVAILFGFVQSVRSQYDEVPKAKKWCDSELSGIIGREVCWTRHHDYETDTSWGYIFPSTVSPKGNPPTELIGILRAPAVAGWIGVVLGGPMQHNPQVLAWLDYELQPVISVRQSQLHSEAPPLGISPGPKISVLSQSGLTSTGHQRIVWHCQNCTRWTGGTGGMNLDDTVHFGIFTHTRAKPYLPSNSGSGVEMPDLQGQHSIHIPDARVDSYWDILEALPMVPPKYPS
ncbi:hypothetical protein DFP72DRAFT_640552 [Ephemerocybe angulata]|uniref:Cellobiose dehydrogenase-like cytochrome domain-containing protein n=1 Tax=Ephemerocybe angulata TaxID=980116 RepID=A0A8H6HFP3_9AGAR|nr:hypothetical protein DFP72DRAFT_640552 [Tulosesus angulatus]